MPGIEKLGLTMALEPPRPALPSLNALRAFEAAARHGSFVKAGNELHVTAAAIAQQVRQLEEWCGKKLFERLPRGVQLTADARVTLPRLVDAFDRLGSSVQALRALNETTEVRIAAMPSVAILWLSPLMREVRHDFPDLQVSISALEAPPDFRRDLFDLGLFFVQDNVTGTQSVLLKDDYLVPVCSPVLINGPNSLRNPADLKNHTLIHDSVWNNDWEQWVKYAGVRGVDTSKGPSFSLYSMALEATKEAGGVLIGHAPLIGSSLDSGELVIPFDMRLKTNQPLSLLLPHNESLRDRVSELVLWIQRKARG